LKPITLEELKIIVHTMLKESEDSLCSCGEELDSKAYDSEIEILSAKIANAIINLMRTT
jgi:hypothetical protein